jgi:hypothetical protein
MLRIQADFDTFRTLMDLPVETMRNFAAISDLFAEGVQRSPYAHKEWVRLQTSPFFPNDGFFFNRSRNEAIQFRQTYDLRESVNHLDRMISIQNQALQHLADETATERRNYETLTLLLHRVEEKIAERPEYAQRFDELNARIQELFQNASAAREEGAAAFHRTEEHLRDLMRAFSVVDAGLREARTLRLPFALPPDQGRLVQRINHSQLNQHWLTMGEQIRRILALSDQLHEAHLQLFTLEAEIDIPIQREVIAILQPRELTFLQHLLRIWEETRPLLPSYAIPLLIITAVCCLVSLVVKRALPLLAIPAMIAIGGIMLIAQRVLAIPTRRG